MLRYYKYGMRVVPLRNLEIKLKRQYPVQNYDYVLCNAEYWKDPYSQAFNVEKRSSFGDGNA